MASKRRAVRVKPPTLGLRHGFATERVLSYEAGAFQPLFHGGKLLECGLEIGPPRDDILRDRHQKSEAILRILQLYLADEPVPIQLGVRQHYPG